MFSCDSSRACGNALNRGAPLPGASSSNVNAETLGSKEALYFQAFQRFDKDGSGYVDVGELQELLVWLGRPNNNSELWKCMDAVDSTPPYGLVDFNELKSYMESIDSDSISDNQAQWTENLAKIESGATDGVIHHDVAGTKIITEAKVSDAWTMGKKLGSGKYATVYLCTANDGAKSAVKVFHKKDREKRQIYDIIKEANTMRMLSRHPNIAAIQDILETRERLLLIMEYLPGKQLYDEVLRRKHFSEKSAAKVVYQLCSALQHCHQKNVIHCDLKPENVMCTVDPQSDNFDIKLTDFGLSKIVVPESDDVLKYCGTPLYMAPEMIRREQYGPAIDMWSVGAMAHELLCGQPPFTGRNRPELEKNIKGFRGIKRFRKENLPNGPTTTHIVNEWEHCAVQESAQDLIAHMLHHKAFERMTAQQALQHPWLAAYSNVESDVTHGTEHMETATEKLLTQQVKRKLRRAVTKLGVINHWSFMLSTDQAGQALSQKIARVNNKIAKNQQDPGCKCAIQ